MTVKTLNAKSLWRAVKAEMELTLSTTMYKTWVEKTEVGELSDNKLEVFCASNHAKQKLEIMKKFANWFDFEMAYPVHSRKYNICDAFRSWMAVELDLIELSAVREV